MPSKQPIERFFAAWGQVEVAHEDVAASLTCGGIDKTAFQSLGKALKEYAQAAMDLQASLCKG